MEKIIYIFVMCIFLSVSVFALYPEYNTISESFNFVAHSEKDEVVLQPINIDVHGGYDSIQSFTLDFYGDYAGATMYGVVDTDEGLLYCNPNGWVTPNSEGYRTRFDCTVLVDEYTKEQKEETTNYRNLLSLNGVGYVADKQVDNVYGEITITYLDRGQPTISMYGTEYEPNQNGKVWLQLINSTGEYVTDGACQITIYTPQNLFLVESGAMSNSENDGIYYYDLTTPQVQGVYPAVAKCYYDVTVTDETVDGFKLNIGIIDAGDYTKTYTLNGDEHKIKQDSGVLDFEYYVDDMCGLDVSELFLTGMTVTINAKWKDTVINDNIVISIYNYSSSSWLNLSNQIVVPNDRVTVTNFIESNNFTRDGLVNSTGTLNLRFRDLLSAGTDKKVEMDWVQVSCNNYSNPEWQELRGSSEIHITSENRYLLTLDLGELKNTTVEEDFIFHYTVGSQTDTTFEDEEVSFSLFNPFKCEHVLDVKENLGNGTLIEYNYTTEYDASGKCIVTIEKDLEALTNYDIEVRAGNYWKSELYSRYSESLFQSEMINISCQNYILANNLTNFTVPLDTINFSYDALWLSCQGYLNDYYNYEEEIAPFLAIINFNANFSYEQMDALESQWDNVISLEESLYKLSNSVLLGLNLGNSFSLGLITDPYPPTNPLYATYFAQISSSYLTYVQLGLLPSNTWGYDNRTLTDFNITVNTTINESAIPLNVWNHTGRYTHGVII